MTRQQNTTTCTVVCWWSRLLEWDLTTKLWFRHQLAAVTICTVTCTVTYHLLSHVSRAADIFSSSLSVSVFSGTLSRFPAIIHRRKISPRLRLDLNFFRQSSGLFRSTVYIYKIYQKAAIRAYSEGGSKMVKAWWGGGRGDTGTVTLQEER